MNDLERHLEPGIEPAAAERDRPAGIDRDALARRADPAGASGDHTSAVEASGRIQGPRAIAQVAQLLGGSRRGG